MADYCLGVDFGGGACKATLLRSDGRAAATASAEYPTLYGADGAAEQRPDDWLAAAIRNIRAVLAAAGAAPSDIKCVAFDGATHTAVLCDERFEVLRDSVYWTDTRCRRQAERLAQGQGDFIFAACRHFPDTIWTLPQLVYLRETEPQTFGKIGRVLFAKDYVRHFFTGDFVTDRIEAEGSMLYDCRTRDWSDELLALAGLTRAQLPALKNPGDTAGKVSAEAARATGLAAGTPVLTGTTDTAAEVLAAGCWAAGQATVKLATAGRICVVTERPYPDRHIVNYSFVSDGLYYPGAATKSAAASYRWFRDAFGGRYDALDALAADVPAGADGLLFHPYLNGELTPCANPALRGSFIGISARHGRPHFARAVLEGVAYSMLDCKLYLESAGLKTGDSAVIGGGAKSALWRQILADALNVRLYTTAGGDSSFGSAMLAGTKAGFFHSLADAAAKCCAVTGETAPDPALTERYRRAFDRYKRVQAALNGLYGET